MHKYEYHYQPPNRPRKKNRVANTLRLAGLCTFLFIVIALSYSLYKVVHDNMVQKSIISPVASSVTKSIDSASKIFFPTKLGDVVTKSLDGTQGTYAVAIKNLRTGESYYLNERKKFYSASLYKLWVMATAYRQIEAGKLDPDKELKFDIPEINKRFKIASESAELTEGVFDMPVRNALNQMIVISHNYSALSLTLDIGLSKVAAFIKEQGFTGSKVGGVPFTTALDIESFYEKLYAGKLAGKKETAEMIALLKKQQLNDRIPRLLPENVAVAHKTGELDGAKHDAGIVYGANGPYIIVILSDSKNPLGAAEREALLSKAVYEYFESK